ncbi:MFS transporter [Polymorphospora rubra]|uniref:MFS transporter n=2 Tax=Polymorphospora rubra TaxID=338584 RepID=A0A810MZD6_9ACTN|nr:MFS transporter [Polymorphospora rubra]BCJ64748.1 MFS transporter [Polymorphospora rubra]
MTDHTAKAGAREWVGLAVLVLPALLASMDLSVLFMATPWISADLQPSGTQLLWVMDVYGFLMAGLLLTMGSLGDRIGRRKLLLIGAVAFGAASLLAAYANSTELLIAARALLGIGGATLAPSTLALIRNMFHDADQRRAAIGIWTGAFTGGVALGPIIGGLLLEHFWWGSVFLINVPVMVLLLILAPILLPEHRDPAGGRFDLLSALLSIAAVLPVIYGIKELAEVGLHWPAVLAIVVGLGFGVLFVRRQSTMADPLIDIGFFRNGAFSAAIAAYAIMVFASAGTGYLAVQYMQVVLGLRPFTAALWMLPTVGGTMVGIALATALVRVARPALVAGAGLAVAGCGFLLVSRIGVDSSEIVVIAGYTVLTLGIGMVAPLAIDLIVSTAPPSRAGTAAALGETGAEFGGALGIAVLGSVAIVAYRDGIGDSLPAGVPAGAADAATGTLGGAVAAAGGLPAELAGPLMQAANVAFTDGFKLAAVVGAALLFTTAVVVGVRLRRVRLDQPVSH